MKKTFSIISLGCPRNLVDSESIIGEFRKKGYVFKEEIIGVDTVIINTCGFIEDAKKESIDTILKTIDAKKDGSIRHIIVAGCLSERYPKELKREFKEVDLFRGVRGLFAGSGKNGSISLTPPHYAYIKISEGCRNKCSYCIIPNIKGRYRSRSIDSIVEEVSALVDKGIKEVILIGQDTSLYGIDLYKDKTLSRLLKRLSVLSDEIWLRLLYCHPANLDKDVLKVIRDNKNICRYIDLPIEHINSKILKLMNRNTKKQDIVSLIEYIRKTIPDVALRTSIIVGFPGETKEEFKELLDFIKDIRFERLGVFRYSKEDGTSAYSFSGQLPEKEKENRFNEIMSLQQEISIEINERFKKRILKVLIEEKEDGGYYIGRSEYDAPEVDGSVYVKGESLIIGNFYDVRIEDTYEYDLVGDVLPII